VSPAIAQEEDSRFAVRIDADYGEEIRNQPDRFSWEQLARHLTVEVRGASAPDRRGPLRMNVAALREREIVGRATLTLRPDCELGGQSRTRCAPALAESQQSELTAAAPEWLPEGATLKGVDTGVVASEPAWGVQEGAPEEAGSTKVYFWLASAEAPAPPLTEARPLGLLFQHSTPGIEFPEGIEPPIERPIERPPEVRQEPVPELQPAIRTGRGCDADMCLAIRMTDELRARAEEGQKLSPGTVAEGVRLTVRGTGDPPPLQLVMVAYRDGERTEMRRAEPSVPGGVADREFFEPWRERGPEAARYVPGTEAIFDVSEGTAGIPRTLADGSIGGPVPLDEARRVIALVAVPEGQWEAEGRTVHSRPLFATFIDPEW
jgi:hypothetical protein